MTIYTSIFQMIVIWVKTGAQKKASIKNPKNRLLSFFSPKFTLNGLIGLFYAETWVILKKLGTPKRSETQSE